VATLAPSISSELAQYTLARPASPTTITALGNAATRITGAAWLEAAVQEAVRHIAHRSAGAAGAPAGPFLLLVHPPGGRGAAAPFEARPLTPAVIAGGWAALADEIEGSGAARALLVQPVPEGEEPGSGCMASHLRPDGGGSSSSSTSTSSSSSGECSECTAASAAAASEYSVAAASSSLSTTTVSAGRVGDCCDGEGGQPHPPADEASAAAASSASAPPQLCARHSQERAQYYGLVVLQGAAGAAGGQDQGHGGGAGAPEGCYLLKTTHMVQRALGCSCSQYVLTRVAKGPSLRDQLVASWLV
jgi:hypothetical protein